LKRSAAILLGNILESAELIGEYTRGVTFEAFEESTEKQDAVAVAWRSSVRR
jgi:uncharacterized protein with HEPN domain